jgi:hypothetical protein
MRSRTHFALAVVALCSGCGYDASTAYQQTPQTYRYAPYGSYAAYGYPPPYYYQPDYYQPAPALGSGFGFFGGGNHHENDRDDWRYHQGRREHHDGAYPLPHPVGRNAPPSVVPPVAGHSPPPVSRPNPPPAAQRPTPAGNAAARPPSSVPPRTEINYRTTRRPMIA